MLKCLFACSTALSFLIGLAILLSTSELSMDSFYNGMFLFCACIIVNTLLYIMCAAIYTDV